MSALAPSRTPNALAGAPGPPDDCLLAVFTRGERAGALRIATAAADGLRRAEIGPREIAFEGLLHADADVRREFPDARERFEELFEQSVRRCVSLGQSAICLSGGLDSISVAAMATDVTGELGLP